MRGRSRGISKSVLACIAILGGAGIGGLAAGLNARTGLSPQPASSTVVAAIADMAPSDCVNLRFPADWADAAAEPVSRMLALASADGAGQSGPGLRNGQARHQAALEPRAQRFADRQHQETTQSDAGAGALLAR